MKNINKILKEIEKELKKPNGNIAGKTFVEFYNNKKLTTYSKEVVNTKLDPRLKGGEEYGKNIRYLTDKEIKGLKQTNSLDNPQNPGLINKSKKTQGYMDRKRRQI